MSREAALKAWATRRGRGGGARILTTGKRAMATNLGGKARSGPRPTRTSQLTAALKASIKGGQAIPGRFWDVGKKRPVLKVGAGARAAMTKAFNRGMREGPW